MKYATTFGASKIDDKKLYEEGVELGRFLAQLGYTVKCGGYQGLMEAVSKGVHIENGQIIGVRLKEFEHLRQDNPYLTEKITADDIFERLKILTKDSELFVVQYGRIGTLNELFVVWMLKYSLNKNFRVCLIGKNYSTIKNCGFIPKEPLKHLEFFKNLEEFKHSF